MFSKRNSYSSLPTRETRPQPTHDSHNSGDEEDDNEEEDTSRSHKSIFRIININDNRQRRRGGGSADSDLSDSDIDSASLFSAPGSQATGSRLTQKLNDNKTYSMALTSEPLDSKTTSLMDFPVEDDATAAGDVGWLGWAAAKGTGAVSMGLDVGWRVVQGAASVTSTVGGTVAGTVAGQVISPVISPVVSRISGVVTRKSSKDKSD